MEKQILKILESHKIGVDDGFGGLNEGVMDDSFDDIVKETTSHVFKFLEWFQTGLHGFGRIEYSKELLYVNFTEGSEHKYTLKEIYEYWWTKIENYGAKTNA